MSMSQAGVNVIKAGQVMTVSCRASTVPVSTVHSTDSVSTDAASVRLDSLESIASTVCFPAHC